MIGKEEYSERGEQNMGNMLSAFPTEKLILYKKSGEVHDVTDVSCQR